MWGSLATWDFSKFNLQSTGEGGHLKHSCYTLCAHHTDLLLHVAHRDCESSPGTHRGTHSTLSWWPLPGHGGPGTEAVAPLTRTTARPEALSSLLPSALSLALVRATWCPTLLGDPDRDSSKAGTGGKEELPQWPWGPMVLASASGGKGWCDNVSVAAACGPLTRAPSCHPPRWVD